MRRGARVATAVAALIALYASLVGPRAVALVVAGDGVVRLVGVAILAAPIALVWWAVVHSRRVPEPDELEDWTPDQPER